MSSIIKSFRVVNKEVLSEEDKRQDALSKTIEPIIEEAKKDSMKIINEAELKAEKILENAKKESLIIVDKGEEKKESLIHNAYEKSKEIFSKSKKDGFDLGHREGYDLGYGKGYEEGKLKSDKLIEEALDIKKQWLKSKSELLKKSEEDIIELVTVIFEKIIHKKTEEDNELIVSLILKGLEDLDLNHKLTIITSKDDYDIVDMSKNIILAKFNMISELEVKYDSDFQKGDCTLETSKGSIDASLNNQISEVKELLTSILNNE